MERLIAAHGDDIEVGSLNVLLRVSCSYCHRSQQLSHEACNVWQAVCICHKPASVMTPLYLSDAYLLQAMRRDTKLNTMLLPASKLAKMLQSYRTYDRNAGVDFRVPHRGHKRQVRK